MKSGPQAIPLRDLSYREPSKGSPLLSVGLGLDRMSYRPDVVGLRGW